MTVAAPATPRRIAFAGQVDLAAAADDSDPSSPAKATLLAYTGGQMQVGFGSPVVLDLAGGSLPTTLPILADHRNAIDAVLGMGRPAIKGGSVIVDAEIVRTSNAQHLLALAKGGMSLQASVGVDVAETSFIRAGDSVRVNKRDFTGPVYVARRWTLREVSVVPMGADQNTRSEIKAAGTGVHMEQDIAAERGRIESIDRIIASNRGQVADEQLDAIRQTAVDNGLDEAAATRLVDAAALVRLRASRGRDVPGAVTPRGLPGDITPREFITAAALVATGETEVSNKRLGEKATEAAIAAGVGGLFELAMAALRVSGRSVDCGGREATIKAAFSSTDLPIALGDSIAKRAIEAYEQTPATWRGFTRRESLANFREAVALRLDARNSRLVEVPPTGELSHLRLGEQEVGRLRLKTKGKIVGISRQDIINDDLSMFAGLPRDMSVSAAETLSDDFYTLLLNAGSAYFDATLKNVLTGAGSALSIESLSAAVALMRKQTAPDGKPISMRPSVLVVPPELEGTARAVLNSTETRSSSGGPTGNPVYNIADLQVEPRLSNATFTGNSATRWFLFALPQSAAMLAGFLNGREAPTVESVDASSDVLGRQWRVYFDTAVSLGDYRGAVRADGAGE